MGEERDGSIHDELRNEARRIEEDCEYTGRGHQELGRWWRRAATWLGLPAVVLAAATSAGAGLSALTGGDPKTTAALAFVSTIATAVRLFFRPDEQARSHSTKGGRYVNLRNQARRFANIEIASGLSTDALQDRLARLADAQDALRLEEPREIPQWVYERVKRQIEGGNYRHTVDNSAGEGSGNDS